MLICRICFCGAMGIYMYIILDKQCFNYQLSIFANWPTRQIITLFYHLNKYYLFYYYVLLSLWVECKKSVEEIPQRSS